MSAVLAKTADVYVKKADERLKTVRLFRRNACMKHGLPYEEDDVDSAIKTESSQLAIIDKVVDKLVDKAVEVRNGLDGKDGRDGADGKDADPNVIADLVTKKVSALIPAATHAPAAPANCKSWRDIAKIAVASLGTGAIAAPIGYYIANSGDKPTVNPIVVEQPAEERSGSLLQYLEDEGYSVGDEHAN